jgi:hypothetical protein
MVLRENRRSANARISPRSTALGCFGLCAAFVQGMRELNGFFREDMKK